MLLLRTWKYLAGGSSAHGEDLRRRTAFFVGGGEAIGDGEAEAVGEGHRSSGALIGESGAVPGLVPLLRCSEPWTQEHAVTALSPEDLQPTVKICVDGLRQNNQICVHGRTTRSASTTVKSLMELVAEEGSRMVDKATGGGASMVAAVIVVVVVRLGFF
ncbi:hypothetical protein LR48_Vigan09g117700 [Vigna angularis]|uniref:Uncharacterized protein n=1 Tax=Phaseolus angularis TaxID=3914 RepID=A0A0L9VBZ2_PHAAN|nr:hypothetical protein LR48_Vigan09g117700 [Vigna angularis]